jgi:hypothetical protein
VVAPTSALELEARRVYWALVVTRVQLVTAQIRHLVAAAEAGFTLGVVLMFSLFKGAEAFARVAWALFRLEHSLLATTAVSFLLIVMTGA